jgi:hypothetical protein
MKGILGALLFEVSILNYVIQRDPFWGHFVEPCGDLKCIGDYIMDHSLSISSTVGCVYLIVTMLLTPRPCCAQAMLLLLNVY